MPSRNRLLHAALGCVLAVSLLTIPVAAFLLATWGVEHSAVEEPAECPCEGDKASNEDGEPNPTPSAGVGVQAEKAATEDRPPDYAAQDLLAQQQMATATDDMVWIGKIEALVAVGTLILTGIAVYFAYSAAIAAHDAAEAARETVSEAQRATKAARDGADAAKTANDIQQKAVAAQLRPWVTFEAELITGLAIEDTSDGRQMRFNVGLRLVNVGAGAAKNVNAKVEALNCAGVEVASVFRRVINSQQARFSTDQSSGFILGPNETEHMNWGVMLGETDLQRALGETFIVPAIIVVLTYRSVEEGERLFYYAKTLTMFQPSPDRVGAMAINLADLPLSREAVHLATMPVNVETG